MASSVAILGLLSRQIALERVGSIYQGHEKQGCSESGSRWLDGDSMQGCAGLCGAGSAP